MPGEAWLAENSSSNEADMLGPALKRADGLLSPLEDALNLLSGLLIFALMFLGMLQIILRTVFRSPMFGYIDFVELGMIAFALFSISQVQRLGGHVRMEIVVGALKGAALWAAEVIGVLVQIAIVGVLIPYSYSHFLRSWQFGDSTIDIELSVWPAKLVVPVMLSVLMLRLLIQLFGYIRLTMNPSLTPVAVPVMKSVEQQAEEEIKGAKG
jgi:TRAP-type C4-dicarboxylate transport system permease small subunit